MRMRKKILSIAAALCIAGCMVCIPDYSEADAASGYVVENLDRGISAISTGSGMMVSWRFLADDSDNSIFKLYRNNALIYTSNAGNATCYLDKDGKSTDTYKVETVESGTIVSSDTCAMQSGSNYLEVKLDVPKAQTSGITYSPNDCTVGDVDGDGQYELFVKWDPSNSKDNSQKGKTDKVFIDCYKIDGTKLWRIDLGVNIRAGAHYTQMLVADYDLDGLAEMVCKTADGTVDGVGNVIGDSSKDYRNSNGYILSGPEYYTLFEGSTGKALDTVDYNPGRGTVSKWGDSYGNRVDRFLGAVAYLDGVKPSAVTVRGYYTRMTACAYDVVNKKLVQKWYFDTGNDKTKPGYGDGNHNCMPADVDNDGKQEIVLGATCLDDDGSVLWCLNTGHGDAMHLGDLLPDRKGLELWICHEDKPYGVSLVDASNGKTIFHKDGDADTGRCCAANVWAGNDGAEFWGLGNDVFDGSGNTLSCRRPAVNFLSYWDGDLEREILDGYTDKPATISKMKNDGTLTTILSTDGAYTCNTTKGTPCLSADIFGDWREELIVRASDSKSLRIYCTPYETDYRITTLMHDPQYRNQVAGQNISYNQPPHTSFYLASNYKLPERPNVSVLDDGIVIPPSPVFTPAVLTEGAVYMIQNENSGLYMEVKDANAENTANVQQWGAESSAAHNTWRVLSAGNGYYYLYSQLGDKVTYLLDIDMGKSDNGTNIQIYTDTKADAQQFKFVRNDDGTYYILTKSSGDKSCVAVSSASTSSGANIIQWEYKAGDKSQKWILTQVEDTGCIMDTNSIYMFKNLNSGLYMEAEGGKASDNTNVQQWGADGISAHNSWTLKSFGGGYYYVISQLADGKTYYLNISGGTKENGGNAEILTNNKTSSHLFKFVKNPDGSYYILTRASKDAGALETAGGSKGSGANVQQWEVNGESCQKWIVEASEPVYEKGDININKKVDVSDIVIMNKYLVKLEKFSEQQFFLADINDDGKVNVFDYILIRRKVM
ncbi:RICIN domain-containing protein [Porcipelethomonas ammoniilytica]|uniref:rhamnogalacturonan lyase family protein n=2 Tax=Oscillospiraceae TaxID=216572 RepID=UPI000822290B|nr:RICIN domain-containing protein [Porcipelethomonas ammoniilytica]MCU6719743.1 RICIN domain-containing protein [Porcipelethomonas ammoniilytica]SCI91167.1 Rhamnogalacturonan exolyase yesX [uncultured Ruminococcus sp.]